MSEKCVMVMWLINEYNLHYKKLLEELKEMNLR